MDLAELKAGIEEDIDCIYHRYMSRLSWTIDMMFSNDLDIKRAFYDSCLKNYGVKNPQSHRVPVSRSFARFWLYIEAGLHPNYIDGTYYPNTTLKRKYQECAGSVISEFIEKYRACSVDRIAWKLKKELDNWELEIVYNWKVLREVVKDWICRDERTGG